MPNSSYDPSDPRYWEEPESNEELDPSYYWANDDYDEDDDYEDPGDDEPGEPLDLGACCHCQRDNHPQNILALDYQTPYGFGWGCFTCGLPQEGAIAVMCDLCIQLNLHPIEFVKGEALKRERAPIAELTEPFRHNLDYHPEVKDDKDASG